VKNIKLLQEIKNKL